jgi:GT2 family glycosyltransferase
VQTTHCRYEIVIVDGASTDETPAVLQDAKWWLGDKLQVIRETSREGFVKAANKGFRAARGRNLIWLNDDARPLDGALDRAVDQIDRSPITVGLLALFHRVNVTKNIAYETYLNGEPYRLLHVRGTLYANFGLGSAATFRRVDYFDERYFVNGADPDLSLKIWHLGLRVVPAMDCLIDHDEHPDARRSDDATRAAADNRKLFEKWDLPEKNPAFNDFNPMKPCTLRGLREAKSVAA